MPAWLPYRRSRLRTASRPPLPAGCRYLLCSPLAGAPTTRHNLDLLPHSDGTAAACCRPVLNICDVVLALLRLRANGGDWPDALDAAIPRRKRAAAAAARAGAGVAAAGVGPVGAAGAGAAAGRGPTPAAAPASAAAAALTSDQ